MRRVLLVLTMAAVMVATGASAAMAQGDLPQPDQCYGWVHGYHYWYGLEWYGWGLGWIDCDYF